jgi:hypothetical protein
MIIAIVLSSWYVSLLIDSNDGERRDLDNRRSRRKSRGFVFLSQEVKRQVRLCNPRYSTFSHTALAFAC